jgi:hypothetical protein
MLKYVQGQCACRMDILIALECSEKASLDLLLTSFCIDLAGFFAKSSYKATSSEKVDTDWRLMTNFFAAFFALREQLLHVRPALRYLLSRGVQVMPILRDCYPVFWSLR